MRAIALIVLASSSVLGQAPAMTSTSTPARPIVIHADRVLDGTGHTIAGGTVVVTGDKITSVNAKASQPATYDLKGMTLLPGLIDAHAHVMWYFNHEGRFHQGGRNANDKDTPA